MPFAVRAYDAGIPYIQMFDPDINNPTYVGWADPGTATSASTWRIYKVASGSLLFAEGSVGFDKCWDSRASYVFK